MLSVPITSKTEYSKRYHKRGTRGSRGSRRKRQSKKSLQNFTTQNSGWNMKPKAFTAFKWDKLWEKNWNSLHYSLNYIDQYNVILPGCGQHDPKTVKLMAELRRGTTVLF